MDYGNSESLSKESTEPSFEVCSWQNGAMAVPWSAEELESLNRNRSNRSVHGAKLHKSCPCGVTGSIPVFQTGGTDSASVTGSGRSYNG